MLLLQKVDDEGKKQTSFLRSADRLVFIGAVYYVASWLHQVLSAGGHTISVGWWGVAEEVIIIIAVIILVVVIRKYLAAIKARLVLASRQLRQTFQKMLGNRKKKQE
jgi:hypothetical protein